MKNFVCMAFASLLLVVLLAACVVSRDGDVGLLLPPPLPVIVDVGPDRHYSHEGYHYYENNGRWQYSRERDGSRHELPKSHYPREIRRHDN